MIIMSRDIPMGMNIRMLTDIPTRMRIQKQC